MMFYRPLTLLTLLICLFKAIPVLGAEKGILFSRPIACSLDGPCWIAQYPDHDPGPMANDSACGSRSYNEHNGTDFAIPDQKTLVSGIDVLAIADGKILRSRDGVPDQKFAKDSPDTVKGIECGNGFVIDHGNGWQSQYCHMKQGSIVVKPDMVVKRGQVLGQVGQSGKAEFPHLHITIRHDNQAIDPFTTTPINSPCSAPINPAKDLWQDDAGVIFRPVQISKIGLSGQKIDQNQIDQNSQTGFQETSDALLLWAEIWGTQPGDRLTLKITAPDGTVIVNNTSVLDAIKARYLRYGGIKRKSPTWPQGHYTGLVRLERNGIAAQEKTIILSPGQ